MKSFVWDSYSAKMTEYYTLHTARLKLIHSYLETRKRAIGKHNVASDQGPHCLLTGFSIKNGEKTTNLTPLK